MRRAALALLLYFACASCITAQQWQRLRTHGTATLFAAVLGGVGVAVTGPLGLVLVGTGVLGGVVIDQALEPDPEVRVRTVTTIIEYQPNLPDGTEPPPVVRTFVDKRPSETPDDFRLPGGLGDFGDKVSWTERLWMAFKLCAWIFFGALLLIWVLRHPVVRGALWAALCWLVAGAWHAGARGITALKDARPKRPTDPPASPEGP